MVGWRKISLTPPNKSKGDDDVREGSPLTSHDCKGR